MPSPYSADPPSPAIQKDADSIFYGNKGVLTDATVLANLTSVIADGITNALTSGPVKDALEEVVTDGIVGAIEELQANGKMLTVEQNVFLNVLRAYAEDKKTGLMTSTSDRAYADLEGSIDFLVNKILNP